MENNWNGLKAAMYCVSILAIAVFTTIMTGTLPFSLPFVAATCIAVASVGLTASICTAVYYGTLSCDEDTKRRNLPNEFTLEFEIEFNKNRTRKALNDTTTTLAKSTPKPVSTDAIPTAALQPKTSVAPVTSGAPATTTSAAATTTSDAAADVS